MPEEYSYGNVQGVTPDTIDFFQELTMDDLLNALEEENVTSCDILLIGKKVTSGKETREVGAFWAHFEDTEEIFTYLAGEYDPQNADDSMEIFQQIFGLPEVPEKVVGFTIRPT